MDDAVAHNECENEEETTFYSITIGKEIFISFE